MHTLEPFSIVSKSLTSLRHTTGSQKLASLFHPIRRKTKASGDSIAHVFPRFASTMFNYFEFWLVHCCVLYDWLEWFLWFWLWFYDTSGWIRISLASVTFLICISGEVVKKFPYKENVTNTTICYNQWATYLQNYLTNLKNLDWTFQDVLTATKLISAWVYNQS